MKVSENKNQNEASYQQAPVFSKQISLGLGYICSSPFGAPAYLWAVLLRRENKMAKWNSMALSVAASVVGCDVDQVTTTKLKRKLAEFDEWKQVQLEDGSILTIAPFGGDMCRRWIFKPIPGVIETKRVDLTYLTADELKALNKPFNLEEATQYTLAQIKQGVLSGVAKASSKPKPSVEGKTDHRQAQAPMRSAVSEGGAHEAQAPMPAPMQDAEPRKPNRPSTKAVGWVRAAYVRTVKSEGKRPYDIFTVVVEDKNRREHIFTGVDLSEKFDQGDFAIGDHISIEKRSFNFSSSDGKGKEKPMRKNKYEITRL